MAFQEARVLLSAVELGFFSELAQGPLDAEQLRERLGLHPRGAHDFFDALVALGLLERHDGRYANAPETACFLDPAKPTYIGGALERASTHLYHVWGGRTEALRTGRPQAPESRPGCDRWAERYRTPAGVQQVVRAMTGSSREAMQAIARKFSWDRYRTFIDIGTAEGDLPVQVALAHPHLTGGRSNPPPVQPAFEAYVAACGLSHRLRFYPGDFFTDPLPAADVLVLGSVLHNWNLDQRRLLLAKAYAALPAGGALIVKEALIDDERRQNAAALLASLHTLLNSPEGANFTAAECRAWMAAAGFRGLAVAQLAGPYAMVVGCKEPPTGTSCA